MDMFKEGAAWARNVLLDNASEPISISSGSNVYRTNAVIAKSIFEDSTPNGQRVNVEIVDFIISSEVGYEPKKGDAITYGDCVYIVRPLGKEIWRFGDAWQTMIRFHAQYNGAAIQ